MISRNSIDTLEKNYYTILLAVDGVYKNGRYIESESRFVIPNDYIIGIAKKNKGVIFGASVHPYRHTRAMLAEATRCIEEGAVFFHWIPSLQQIDTDDERCVPFYKLIARDCIPLVCNTGLNINNEKNRIKTFRYDDPQKLKKALDIGIKIIVSHRAETCYDANFAFTDDQNYLDALVGMLRISEENKWELYVDLSPFCHPMRIKYLEVIKREVSKGTINSGRFIYGCNFSIPLIDLNTFSKPLNLHDLLELMK